MTRIVYRDGGGYQAVAVLAPEGTDVPETHEELRRPRWYKGRHRCKG